MDDLIWSVKPKHTVAERKRLVAMQPVLLSNLRTGMERLSIPATERDDFIARLVHAHGRTAVNKSEQDEAAEVAENTPEAVQPGETATPEQAPERQVRAHRASADKPKTAGATPVDDEYAERVRMLKSGTWLEINGRDGKAVRAKLSWVSPITGTYLFTDRQGLKAGNYTLEELAQLLRTARARVLNSTPLMDRAVGTVLKQYQQQ